MNLGNYTSELFYENGGMYCFGVSTLGPEGWVLINLPVDLDSEVRYVIQLTPIWEGGGIPSESANLHSEKICENKFKVWGRGGSFFWFFRSTSLPEFALLRTPSPDTSGDLKYY